MLARRRGLEELEERSVRREPELVSEHGEALRGEEAVVEGAEGLGDLVVDVFDVVEEAHAV